MEGEEPHGGTAEAPPEADVSIGSPPAAPDTETGSADAWCQEAVEAEKAVEEQWRREEEREKQQAREAAEPWQGLTLDCRPEKLEDANYAPSAAEGRGEGGVGIAIVKLQDGKIFVTGVHGGSRCAPSADNRCSAACSPACSHCAAVKANRGYIKDFIFKTVSADKAGIKVSDHIVSIQGQTVQNKSVAELQALISGTPGSVVSLLVTRSSTFWGIPTEIKVDLTRELPGNVPSWPSPAKRVTPFGTAAGDRKTAGTGFSSGCELRMPSCACCARAHTSLACSVMYAIPSVCTDDDVLGI